jgi:HD-like signal output (HDOD) protein
VRIFSQVPLGLVNMKLFWEHSVAVGVFAKAIGQYSHQAQSERFYVAGLLHDIGRLLFYIKLPGVMHDLLLQREAQEQCLYILEREALEYTHAEAGGRLLQSWRVPDSIFEPVSCHHSPAQSQEFPAVTAAVHIADIWVNKHGIGTSGERFAPPIDAQALATLNIQEFELEELWNLTRDEISEVINQFLVQ